MRSTILRSLLAGCISIASLSSAFSEDSIHWQGWSDTAFEQAQKEHKFVILDLEAVWCHWCHVMEEKTYSQPDIIKLMNSKYIALKVDQDSRPDLSTKYMEYGWPATIIFGPDGKELAKRAGFIPPDEMKTLLQKIIKNPTPEKDDFVVDASDTKGSSTFLSDELRKELQDTNLEAYDDENGGWGIGGHKFLDWDSVEYSISRAKAGDKKSEEMAKGALKAQLNLLDPVWGGMYQYSTGGTWDHPHFEKIMSIQAENLRAYAQAYGLWQDPVHLNAAMAIHQYLNNFLKSPDGTFYTSQDADLIQGEHSASYFALNDVERRKLGIPRVDKHVYSRENGWVINALMALYNATGDKAYVEEGKKAAEWIIENRSIPGGGFRHDATDSAGPYLGDTLSMGRAFLALYLATGERPWLAKAEEAAKFIEDHFKDKEGQPGYLSSQPIGKLAPRRIRDENVIMARFANLLFHTTGNPTYKGYSENAMKYLTIPIIARQLFPGTTLLVDSELTNDPLHITVVGHKDDPNAQALYQSALKYPAVYKRLDWWDKREGPMPNPDVQYPELEKAAAFICTEKRCSLPVFKPDDLAPLIERITSK